MISVLPVRREQEKEDRNRKYLQNQVGRVAVDCGIVCGHGTYQRRIYQDSREVLNYWQGIKDNNRQELCPAVLVFQQEIHSVMSCRKYL